MKPVDTSLQKCLFPNISEDGWKFVSVMAIVSLILTMIWFILGCASIVLTVWCFYSFRDPERVTPILSSAVIAPADGQIISITREKGPEVLGLERRNFTRVCIFCNYFNVHVNRMPIKGKVNKMFYDEGKNFSGSFDRNNIANEKLVIALRHSNNVDFVLQQIVPFCNKRIVSKLKNGDEFEAGQRFASLRFGGYVDIFLPEKVEPQVCVGQSMVAGETIMAYLKSDAPRIEGEIR